MLKMKNSSQDTVLLLQNNIENIWLNKESVNSSSSVKVKDYIEKTLQLLDSGQIRVSEKINGTWTVNEWIKKAVLLSFRIRPLDLIDGGPENSKWWDKIPSKFSEWTQEDFSNNNFRTVPGSVVRYSAYVAPEVVLMPSFVNLGARIDSGTMIDTWATVGSCAQIGKNCHISGGVGIGGVLEPLQASPVIIEDNCFIGARSEVAEGVIVEEGSLPKGVKGQVDGDVVTFDPSQMTDDTAYHEFGHIIVDMLPKAEVEKYIAQVRKLRPDLVKQVEDAYAGV